MISTLLALVLYFDTIHFSSSQWISPPNPTLSLAISRAAVGLYHDTIYIIGGRRNENGLMQYNLSSNLISNDPSFFNNSLQGYSQWWYQINNILYIAYDLSIGTFHLQTRQFTESAIIVPVPIESACLAGDHSQSLLYYLGGGAHPTYSDSLQILNLSSGSWTTGPNMNLARNYFTCIVSPNKQLYAIGGGNGTRYIRTIEVIPTANIVNNQWSRMQSLSEAADRLHSVSLDDNIFVIGGWLGSGEAQDIVHIINTTTNQVSLADDRLVYPAMNAAPIVVDRTIYAFGGGIEGGGETDNWQYISIPLSTEEPTTVPTKEPSTSPSKNPSLSPSQQPSISPSRYPTKTPTVNPTLNPTTASPTKEPTHDATDNLTTNPSSMPSDNTDSPSSNPTFDPSSSTSAPTNNPTTNPSKVGVDGNVLETSTSALPSSCF